jgi:hypothetical protein
MFKCLAADRQSQRDTVLTLKPSVIPNSKYIITESDWNCLNIFACFFYYNHQVHRDFLSTLYILQCKQWSKQAVVIALRVPAELTRQVSSSGLTKGS